MIDTLFTKKLLRVNPKLIKENGKSRKKIKEIHREIHPLIPIVIGRIEHPDRKSERS